MKPFSEIQIADGTSPGENVDVIDDIYVPVLQNSNLHQRLTYSFSAYGLVELAVGLEKFIKNNGKMELIVGSTLKKDEEEAIYTAETQLKKDEQYQKLCMIRLENLFESIIHDPSVVDSDVPTSLDLLTNLIASNSLEIKFLYKKNTMKDPSDISIQHSKIAIFHGVNDEKVVWGGSTNFSRNAFVNSIEEISVYKSWDAESGYNRHGSRLIQSFNRAWTNKVDDWHSCAVPSKFYSEWRNFHNKNSKLFKLLPISKPKPKPKPIPISKPSPDMGIKKVDKIFKLRKHQDEVIENWIKNNYRGIVEHATGSGKTITGIYAIKHFFENTEGTNAIVIVPSVLLQDQWLRELNEHIKGVDIHRVGGKITSSGWKEHVTSYTSKSRSGKKQIVLGVRQSICSPAFYKNLKSNNHLMVLVDEAHTIGAQQSRHFLESAEINFRLALSATYERANDYLGTKRIVDYFGHPLEPKYGIAEAIHDERLVKYDYEIETVSLTAIEEDEWIEQSKKIRQQWAIFESNKKKKAMPIKLKRLLIERAKISKKAKNKVKKALSIISHNYDINESQRWLIYCQDIEQLESLSKEIFNAGFVCSVYYAGLDSDTKKATLEEFYKKGGLLLSIKCLDEGVDIPSADHALILASSSNKREYIQRRGRVLRVDKNNSFKRAKIFDLITVAQAYSDKYIQSLVHTDLIRAYEFSGFARNKSIARLKINELFYKFKIDANEFVYNEKEDIESDEI